MPNSGSKNLTDRSSRASTKSSRMQTEKREKIEDAFTLNLTVYGSSVPVCTQQKKSYREIGSYKSARYHKKQIRTEPPQYPVDKLIFLAERLKLTEGKNRDIEFVTSVSESLKEETVKNYDDDVYSRESFFLSAELIETRERQHFSSPEFSLDLSSVPDTNDGDESCCELEESFQKEVNSSEECSDWLLPSEKHITSGSKITFPPSVCVNRKRTETPSQKNTGSRYRIDCCDKYSGKEKKGNETRRDRSNELICDYVSAVNNHNDVTKYFRLCPTCKEISCSCENYETPPDSDDRESSLCLPMCYQFEGKDEIRTQLVGETTKRNKAIGTDERITHFDYCDCTSGSSPCFYGKKEDICPVCIEAFRKQSFDDEIESCSKPCCCSLDLNWAEDGSASVSDFDENAHSKQIYAYTSSLASAAKSARNLAKDLECILKTFKTEKSDCRVAGNNSK